MNFTVQGYTGNTRRNKNNGPQSLQYQLDVQSFASLSNSRG